MIASSLPAYRIAEAANIRVRVMADMRAVPAMTVRPATWDFSHNGHFGHVTAIFQWEPAMVQRRPTAPHGVFHLQENEVLRAGGDTGLVAAGDAASDAVKGSLEEKVNLAKLEACNELDAVIKGLDSMIQDLPRCQLCDVSGFVNRFDGIHTQIMNTIHDLEVGLDLTLATQSSHPYSSIDFDAVYEEAVVCQRIEASLSKHADFDLMNGFWYYLCQICDRLRSMCKEVSRFCKDKNPLVPPGDF